MANSENKNTRHKALRDLLKKDLNSDQAADDFEREALEGFSLLGDEDEILATKEKLDERMDSEVFAGKKRSKKPGYWLAAAALLLVVGFAVFLVQNAEVSKPKDLAILEPKKAEKTAVPTEPTYRETEAPLSENKNTKTVTSVRSAKHQQPDLSAPAEDQRENRAEKEVPVVETLKKNEKPEPKMADLAGASGIYENKAPATIEERTEMKSQAAPPPSTAINSGRINASSPSVAYSAAGAQTELNTAEIASSKKSKSKKAGPGPAKEPTSNCYYKGGDKALHKELKQKLSQKQLLKPFEAKLWLSTEKKVEKVEFIDAAELSAEEQIQVINLIKTLTYFEFHETPSGPDLIEYRLIFKP